MNEGLSQLREVIASLKLDDSLLYLNHVLSTLRGESTDTRLAAQIDLCEAVPPHVIHFLAKEIIVGSGNFGARMLDWPLLRELLPLAISLDDPIQHDPNWKNADPTSFFIRVFHQQFPAQDHRLLQKIGLAVGLYRDVGAVNYPEEFDLRKEVEAELGTSVDAVIALGFLAMTFNTANCGGFPCSGTFRPMDFAEAYRLGFKMCIPENWDPFLSRVTCSPDRFREVAEEYSVDPSDATHAQFEFNALRRFPVLDVGEQRCLAADPRLIIERVTNGLFFDLFERDRTRFSNRFGYAFDAFVRQLLLSIIPTDKLWSEAALHQRQSKIGQAPSKNADQAYVSSSETVLMECKSLRPSIKLTTYASDESVAELARRLAGAVSQLALHAQSIRAGDWIGLGLRPASCLGVVVSYGKIYTANSPFVRAAIGKNLAEKGIPPIGFVILSIDELDAVVSLVERGHSFEEVIRKLCSDENAFDPLMRFYKDELREEATSEFAKNKARGVLDQLSPR